MGIFFVILAGVLASISNFCMRRSIDTGGSSKAYLVVQLTFSFFVMVLLNPVRTGDYGWNTLSVILGLMGGVVYGFLMWSVGKTVEKGPPGLSFAVLNSATVMPAILMILLFGAVYGQYYTLANAMGSILVVYGLFWAGKTSDKNKNKSVWISFATLMFFIHILFLIYLQWWAMILRPELPLSSLIPFHLPPIQVQWFMPAMLFSAALMQWMIYISSQQPLPKGPEVYYGIGGGVTNGACTFFLILAPQVADVRENAMIFPVFAVSIIILCNAWAQILYQEKVNWKANGLCVAGVLVGTVAWGALLSS